MKIAILSDIHGNYTALKAVLQECEKQNVNHYLLLGDYVGYYYNSIQVIKAIRELPASIIKGNHEVILEDLAKNKLNGLALRKKYGSAHEISLNTLNQSTLSWLYNLPEEQQIILDDLKIYMCHGAPGDINKYLYPDSDFSDIYNIKSVKESNYIFCGHSHYPFCVRLKDKTLVNVGSVGQSRVNGGLAAWCLLNTENESIQLRSTPYNIKPILEQIEKYDPNTNYSKSILFR